ncbi:MAG TPA: AraC family transcriptional regulator [Caulobacteraceae bacterium]
MSLTNRALWVIDRNLGADLTLAGVAQACGVSRHHLAHAFGEAVGQPVMAYLRARRLSEAARALARGAGDILGLALESGYGSHEAFSRAFRARFGATPEAVRRRGSVEGLALTDPISMPESAAAAAGPPPVVQAAGPILAAGLRAPYSFSDLDAIPSQWRRFTPLLAGIPIRPGSIPIGVLTGADSQGRFDYFCAAEVESFSDLPPGVSRLRIAAATYAVFQHPGHIASIRATYARIWNHWPCERPAANAPGLERHNPTFDPATGLGGLSIWVPLTD